MVLYRINLVPLADELRDANTTILSPFYSNDVVFDGSERQSAAQLHLQTNQGMDQGYFPEPFKSLFVADIPKEEKEAARREFKRSDLHLTYIYGIRYMGVYLGPSKDIEAWVRPKVEA